jgi:hypothetical protein
MLQVFYLDVTKVDLDVAYTCMLQAYVSSVLGISYVCCKCFIWMLQVFHLDVAYTCMLQAYVSSVLGISYVCCKCFIWMLQVFHLDVACVLQWFSSVFRCFHKCFRRLFQVFHLLSFICSTVASECFKCRSGVAHGMRVGSGWRRGQRLRRHGPAAGALAHSPCEHRPGASAPDRTSVLASLYVQIPCHNTVN